MPTKLDALKEVISQAISDALTDGQNQIHDLRDNKATPEQIQERAIVSYNFHIKKVIKAIETYLN